MEPSQSNTLPTPVSQQSYSLSTLLLGMTVCSLWLAVLVTLPCVGVCSAVLILPAVIRTISCVNIRKRQGMQTTAGEKVGLLVSSTFAMLGAMMIFLFFLVISFLTLFVFVTVCEEIMQTHPTLLEFFRIATLLGGTCCFFLAQVPSFYFLYQDWPQKYDIWECRFISRWELRQMKRSHGLASPPSTKNLSILAEKKRLCPNCFVPGISAENPCPVCGITGEEAQII